MENQRKVRVGACRQNHIIVRYAEGFDYEVMESVSDCNVFSRMGHEFNLIDWQAKGLTGTAPWLTTSKWTSIPPTSV